MDGIENRGSKCPILNLHPRSSISYYHSRRISLPLVSTRTISDLNGLPSNVSISQLTTSGRAGIANRMALAFEDVEQFRRGNLAHELVDEFHVAVLVVFAGDDHIRAGDFCRHASSERVLQNSSNAASSS